MLVGAASADAAAGATPPAVASEADAALSPVSEHCDGWCELLTGHTCDICAGRPRKSEVLKWFS